jgi:hypothetical protein
MDAASAVVEAEFFEVGEVDAVVGLASGAFSPLYLRMVAETAVVDGD